MDKSSKENRTFETRLLFIKEIFENKYSAEDIFRQSIEHRLGRTYEAYLDELNQSLEILLEKKTLTVMKKVSKGDL